MFTKILYETKDDMLSVRLANGRIIYFFADAVAYDPATCKYTFYFNGTNVGEFEGVTQVKDKDY